jgi:hypothetical protein
LSADPFCDGWSSGHQASAGPSIGLVWAVLLLVWVCEEMDARMPASSPCSCRFRVGAGAVLCLDALAGKVRVRVLSACGSPRVRGRHTFEQLFPKRRAPHLQSSPGLFRRGQSSQSVSLSCVFCLSSARLLTCLDVCLARCLSPQLWSLLFLSVIARPSSLPLLVCLVFPYFPCSSLFPSFPHLHINGTSSWSPSRYSSPARAHSSSVRPWPHKSSLSVQRWTGRDYDLSGALDF